MNRKSIFGVAISFLLIGLMFQNCGNYKDAFTVSERLSQDESVDDLVTETDSEGNPVEEAPGEGELPEILFKAGDAFNPALRPVEVTPQLAEKLARYKALTGFKAAVINAEGEGFAQTFSGGATSNEEVSEILLERCNLTYRTPCVILAEGDKFKYDHEGLFEQASFLPQVQYTMEAIPGVAKTWQDFFNGRYPHKDTYSAFAIGTRGNVHSGWGNASQNEAIRRAYEFCESIENEPCTLYASGTQVSFDPMKFQLQPLRIQYGPAALDPKNVPFLTDLHRIQLTEALAATKAKNRHSVFAISRYGHRHYKETAGVITDSDKASAIAACNNNIVRLANATGYQHVCFVYSVDDQIVFTRKDFTRAALGYE